jgi:hypothetical protein
MSVKDKYHVKSIDAYLTKEWILKKHYAKRMPPIQFAFGLYDINNILIGISTYATPLSSPLRNSWDNKYKVYELNRLVIYENSEKNILSFFVSQSLKLLPSPSVIVSYADTSQNHHGYIYQATNWLYTGLSASVKDYHVKDLEHLHVATLIDMSRGQENRFEWLRNKFGDKLITIDRPRKHRYFYFIGNKNQKKDMLKMLPYQIEPYPKGQNKRYDASYNPTIQTQLF